MVFILQGLHHLSGHHHKTECCSEKGMHIHDEANKHSACNICVFNFEPAEVPSFDLELTYFTVLVSTPSSYSDNDYVRKLRQTNLRGPPCLTV